MKFLIDFIIKEQVLITCILPDLYESRNADWLIFLI